MSEPLDLHPAYEADLVSLADDCLSPRRRAEIEARVAADPAVAAALERQRRALARLAGCPPCPSAVLLERVGALAARGPRRRVPALVAGAVAAVQHSVAPRQRS